MSLVGRLDGYDLVEGDLEFYFLTRGETPETTSVKAAGEEGLARIKAAAPVVEEESERLLLSDRPEEPIASSARPIRLMERAGSLTGTVGRKRVEKVSDIFP